VHEQPEPVRARSPQVSQGLEAVVMRALEKDPAKRFASGRELARALIPTIEKRNRRGDGAQPPRAGDTEPVRRARMPLAGRSLWLGALCAIVVGGSLGLFAGRRARPTGDLIVVSDPPDATLMLDGVARREHTPAALRGLSPGEHRLRVQRAHHHDSERYVNIVADQTTAVELQLGAASHSVEVRSVPADATVYLDGALVAGKTPVNIEVSDDEYHLVRVEKPGYRTWAQKIAPEDDAPLPSVMLAPESVPRGTLFVDAAAPCEVWIDGRYSGFLTPTPGLRLATGEHAVELRSGNAPSTHARVTLGRGETARTVLAVPK
jgi:hypothetical protein